MRTILTAVGLMLVWYGLQMSLFIQVTRRAWALVERCSDAELQRLGIVVLVLGLLGIFAMWG